MTGPIEHPTTIRLPPDLKDKLRVYSVQHRWPVSLLIVHILEDWWKREARKATRKPRSSKPKQKVEPDAHGADHDNG